jgi:cysteine desulfurase
MQIYLDYSATTPARPEVIGLMQTILAEQWGNPASLHAWGNRAALALERARAQVGRLVNVPPETIVFTAGGTEADNLAILGVARQYTRPQHLILSSVEHSAVSQPVAWLEQHGWQVTRLAVDREGRVDPADLQRAIQPHTVLVSVIWGQSEVGTLQPIAELAAIAQERGVLFHSDAVQVAGRLPIDLQALPIDLLSLSSHKLYGPQGAGALYVRPGVELVPLLQGGGQEGALRSGTPAVANLAGFGLAAELMAAEMGTETLRLMALRDRLFTLMADTPLRPTGDRRQRLPHHVSWCWPEADGEVINGKALVRQMNLAGIGISAGAACRSGQVTPSPILTAMGWSDRVAKTGIRLTLGRGTTAEDVDWTALVLRQVMERLVPPAVALSC